ncbi:MAG: restriction endonuclease [Candidatus Hodarchaeota archaeon]
MMEDIQLQKQIASLPEETLTRDIIIPLFGQMGYKNVRYAHGMVEHGIDILCTENTPVGPELCGIQVKAQPITGKRSCKNNFS